MGRGRPEQGLVDWSYASEKPGIRAYLAICGPNIATAIGYRAYKWGYMSTKSPSQETLHMYIKSAWMPAALSNRYKWDYMST